MSKKITKSKKNKSEPVTNDDTFFTSRDGITIKTRNYVSVEGGEHSNDEYAYRGHTHNNIDIQGFTISNANWGSDFTVPKPAASVYLLVVVDYSTGSSFHRESGLKSFVDLVPTSDRADADALARWIKEHPEDHPELTLPSGRAFKFHAPWIGYFEHMEQVEIVTIQLIPCSSY